MQEGWKSVFRFGLFHFFTMLIVVFFEYIELEIKPLSFFKL